MDDAEVGGHIDAAVLFRGGETKDMVVLIDGSPDGAEAVVAVGHGVWYGELRQSARPRGLDDADVGDIMRNQRVESQAQLVAFSRGVVRTENGIGDGLLPRSGVCLVRSVRFSVFQRDRMVMVTNHRILLDRIKTACAAQGNRRAFFHS
ncbi:hypothetical protein SDC9_130033 [bioreactor metagenome]|uniref:Uncharacterized protein n=1 Tax=bioreactor metagenome TaxID=1076179 RepID=A0A645D1H3_9ZZZZ